MAIVPLTPGVLAGHQLQALIDAKIITGPTSLAKGIDASAMDLPLGNRAWRLKEGQRPTTREFTKIKAQATEELKRDAGGYFEFKAGEIYLVELDVHMQLPANVSGRATGKSSVGRLDVITRLITRNAKEYDLVGGGYSDSLHLLVAPQTFTIRVAEGGSLNQLRLFCGPQSAAIISQELIPHYGTPFWYSKVGDDYLPSSSLIESTPGLTDDPFLFDLTVDLGDKRFPYIFRAKEQVLDPIDLGADGSKPDSGYDSDAFFEKKAIDDSEVDKSVILNPRSFYIMKSRERLFIPNDVAVEVVAISERLGDIRIHYAGFAHPGFGRHDDPLKGAPLIFEVRATDMATKLYDESLLARIQLFRMSEKATPKTSPYDKQELRLSKVFKMEAGK